MTNPNLVTCQTCGHHYAYLEEHCSNCGEINPIYLPEPIEENLSQADLTEATPRRRPWWRSRGGCATIFLFCLFIFGCPVIGVFDGLRERAAAKQAELDQTYQQALAYRANNQTDLAILTLEYLLSINPNHPEARFLLAELKATPSSVQPIDPQPVQGGGSYDLDQLFTEASALSQQGLWEVALQQLDRIKHIDPAYQPLLISNAIYTTAYALGLQLIDERRFNEALTALNKARAEKPDDPLIESTWEKVFLYLSIADQTVDGTNGVDDETLAILNRLYSLDPDFADVKSRLATLYLYTGDILADQKQWCLAVERYEAVIKLTNEPGVSDKITLAQRQCEHTQENISASTSQQPNPLSTPTTIVTANNETSATEETSSNQITTVNDRSSDETEVLLEAADSSSGQSAEIDTGTSSSADVSAKSEETDASSSGTNVGKLYFARQNSSNGLWEIFVWSFAEGRESVLLNGGIQPAVNQAGSILVYHSIRPESLGLHAYNLSTGQDLRITTFAEDVLPKWGHDPWQFSFASQRSGDRQWRFYTAFADGKSEAIVIGDGQTPALSPDQTLIAYLGADPSGNNPGIYLIPSGGGTPWRLTSTGGDRNPSFSPGQNRLAYMSVRNGNWDIWTISVAGGEAKTIAPSPNNDGHPVWSPDGSQIAFVSDRDGTWGIYVVDSSGGEARKLTTWGGSRPDWLMGQLSWSR